MKKENAKTCEPPVEESLRGDWEEQSRKEWDALIEEKRIKKEEEGWDPFVEQEKLEKEGWE